MKANKKSLILLIASASLFMVMFNSFGDDLPAGAVPIISCVEGNLTYYVEAGDKVKKGEPLFFIECNDFPLMTIKKNKQDIIYFKRIYDRKKKLAKTNSVAVQELDDAWHDYHNAITQLAITETQIRSGFYTAPFDCEVLRLEAPPTSGMGDGNPVVYVKEIK